MPSFTDKVTFAANECGTNLSSWDKQSDKFGIHLFNLVDYRRKWFHAETRGTERGYVHIWYLVGTHFNMECCHE